MTNRKKRLKKGIDSIAKQIEMHERKKVEAHNSGQIELENYYEKEIVSLKNDKDKKERQLDK